MRLLENPQDYGREMALGGLVILLCDWQKLPLSSQLTGFFFPTSNDTKPWGYLYTHTHCLTIQDSQVMGFV